MKSLPRIVLLIPILAALAGVALGQASLPAGPAGPASPGQAFDPEHGELAVLVRQGHAASGVDLRFLEDRLPAIRRVAEEAGVAVRVVELAGGAPEEVHLTPLLVYRNHLGRSIFQGRTTSTGRLATFLRTARVLPQREDPVVLENVAVWRAGRARIALPVKITPLGGAVPEDHDPEAFAADARAAVREGLRRFIPQERVALGPSDRAFYLDLHPWLGAGGRFFVSAEVYSQFHCEKPVIQRFDPPFEGRAEAWREVFTRAAGDLEEAIAGILASSREGDDFDPLTRDAPRRSWEELGLGIPEAPQGDPRGEGGRGASGAAAALPEHWRIAPALPGDAPRLIFHFASPLDHQAGEVERLHGELDLGEHGAVAGSRGFVEVDTDSITMGQPDLDGMLRSSVGLHIRRHPHARFAIERVLAPAGELAFGRPLAVTYAGTFTMRGITIPLEAAARLEPEMVPDGSIRLRVGARASFRLREPFGLSGPDGPSPANDTVVLEASFLLIPRE